MPNYTTGKYVVPRLILKELKNEFTKDHRNVTRLNA